MDFPSYTATMEATLIRQKNLQTVFLFCLPYCCASIDFKNSSANGNGTFSIRSCFL